MRVVLIVISLISCFKVYSEESDKQFTDTLAFVQEIERDNYYVLGFWPDRAINIYGVSLGALWIPEENSYVDSYGIQFDIVGFGLGVPFQLPFLLQTIGILPSLSSDTFPMPPVPTNCTWGIHISPFGSLYNGTINGLQLSGIFNSSDLINGLSISPVLNTTLELRGMSITTFGMHRIASGLFINVFGQMMYFNGLGIGAASFKAAYAKGMLLSPFNYSEIAAGVMLGAVNYTVTLIGLQIGLINYAGTVNGLQIGLLNISDERIMPLINW